MCIYLQKSNLIHRDIMLSDDDNQELVDILNRFDSSTKGKFERCAHTEWCVNGTGKKGARLTHTQVSRCHAARLLCNDSKFVQRIAKKLSCMKGKVFKTRTGFSRAHKRKSNLISEQITKGSNTPASRPSSISITLEQLDSLHRKQSPIFSSISMERST